MAGNDATSIGFAETYDAGAREAVAALADLTHALIGAGRLLGASGANHASAEVDEWILDQVEGFAWLGADVSLLR
jgi:hypothetical protein